MPEGFIAKTKEPLDEESLKAVKREFNRLKKETPYKRFSITEFIDSGSYAKVYKVTATFSEKEYAIRIADDQGEKTKREIEAVKQLMSQGQKHIVNYLMDFSVSTRFGVKHCTLMDFLCPLSAYSNTADDVEIAVRCGVDLLPLLQVCMNKKILHRDIKPENILFDKNFRNTQGLLLSDFGEARTDRYGTVTGRGTPSTISPEIRNFDADIKHDHSLCDMYSLGIVMYYYLNGRTYPFGNDHDKRVNTKGALPEPRYGSKRLKQLVVKATQYYPKDRFASPREMLEELWQCEEYQAFIVNKKNENEETIIPKTDITADYTRLRSENKELKKIISAQNQELKEARKQLSEQQMISSDNSTEDPVRKALDKQQKNWESFRVAPLFYTTAGIMLIIQLLMIALMIEIRIVGHDSDFISKFRFIVPIDKIMSLGDGWAHLAISGICCGLIFLTMLLLQLCNEATWRGILGSFLGCFAVQSVYILLYAWIKPPFNTRVEQCCWFLVVLMSSLWFNRFILVDEGLNNWKDIFMVAAIVAVLSAIGLLPSFTVLLPGWWGLIITGILDVAVVCLPIMFLLEFEDIFFEFTEKERRVRRTKLTKSLEVIVVSLQLAMQVLMIVLMVYIRIIGKNADVITRMESSRLIGWAMSKGNGWSHFIFSIGFCIVVFIILILLRKWNDETFLGILFGFLGSFAVQIVFLLVYAWINPLFNTRIEQFCWFMVVNLCSVWFTCYAYAEDGVIEDFKNEDRIEIVFIALLVPGIISVVGLIPSFTILLPGWWGLISTGVLNLAAAAFSIVVAILSIKELDD